MEMKYDDGLQLLRYGYESYRDSEIGNMWEGIWLSEKNTNVDNYNDEKEEREEEVNNEKDKTARQIIAKKSAIKRDYEKKTHKEFVDECLRPDDYKKGHGEVFAFFQVSDCGYEKREDGGSTQYHISLMTPAMACTDYIYHHPPKNKPWWYELYRPYYYYLTLDIPNDDAVWNTFYADHKTGMWVEAQIYEPGEEAGDELCWEGLLSFGGSDSYTREISVRFIAQKEEDDEFDEEIREEEDEEQQKKKWKIKREMIDKLLQSYNECLEETETTELSDFLNKTIPKNVREYKVKVLNVGEANCIHIEANQNVSFLFDVGIPYNINIIDENKKERNSNPDYDKNGIGSSIGLIKKYKPDFVMISHLHYDHLLGFIHMCDQGINCHWIMPMPEGGLYDFTVVRIILYVSNKKKLTLVREKYGEKLYGNGDYCDFEVFRGIKSLDDHGNIDLNSGSLILRIRNALFSGDCMYKYWPTSLKQKELLNKIDWLVAPHHGAFRSDETKDNSEVMESFKGKKRSAVVCVGHNDYHHPRDAHFENLIKNDVDSIYVTGGAMDVKYQEAPAGQCKYFKSVNQSVTFTAN